MTSESAETSGVPMEERQRVAANPALMRQRLERLLQPTAGGRYEVWECRLATIRRRDGVRCTARYDLRLVEPTSGRAWDEVVTGIIYGEGRSRRVWEALREAEPADGPPTTRSGLPPYGYLPDLDMLVQVFPHDYRLPALAQVLAGPSPQFLPAILAAFGEGRWTLAEWTAETVQYRGDMRAVVRIRAVAREAGSGQAAERLFYAKIYRNAEEGERGARAQREVYDRVAGGQAGFTVAEPVAYAADLRTLVQGRVHGTPLRAILMDRHGPDPSAAARSAARAVAAFHQLDLAAPPRPFSIDTARLANAREVLRSGRPALASLVDETIGAVVAGLEGVPPGLVHGDLRPDHILIDGDRAALIDFDAMAAGDPIADIANLLTHLVKIRETGRGSGDRAETATRVFAEEYFDLVSASWRDRLPLHRALAGVSKAAGLYQRRVPGRQGLIDDFLREAHAAAVGDGE